MKPTSVVVPIEGTGTFECRAFGVTVYWYINQEQATHLHLTRGVSSASKLLTDGSWNSTLSVLAIPENNNSMVECAVFTFETGETRSPGVSIMIVGEYTCTCIMLQCDSSVFLMALHGTLMCAVVN